MVKFPIKYEVKASGVPGIQKRWMAQAGSLPPISSAIPVEFSGPGGGYSPEDLFALSILNCIIATFKVYCEKSKIQFSDLKGRAILTVDQEPPENSFWMKHIEVFVDVTGASDPQKTRQLLDHAIKNCAVSNSIKSGKTFHVSVS